MYLYHIHCIGFELKGREAEGYPGFTDWGTDNDTGDISYWEKSRGKALGYFKRLLKDGADSRYTRVEEVEIVNPSLTMLQFALNNSFPQCKKITVIAGYDS